MRRGWHLKYGFQFKGGKKQFYIIKDYQIGISHWMQSHLTLEVDEAERIAELIQEEKISERKPETKE